ncbi:MAG: hypothetical protein CME71_08350 [Halobacteriovorax sp.]|nr:hypothetical protein [Halobacteriovorax sp.]
MSDNDKKDLTRIEDLAEFLHDEGDDGQFDDYEQDDEDEQQVLVEAPMLPSLDDLEDSEENSNEPPSFETTEDEVDSALETTEFEPSEFEQTDEEASEFTSDDDEFISDDFELESPSEEPEFEAGFETEEVSEAEPEPESEPNFEASFDTEVESESEPEAQPEFEPAPVGMYDEPEAEEAPAAPAQNFEDLRQFAERISYGAVAQGGNPPFSLILRSIRYQEDAEDILIILREHGLVSDDNEQSIEQGLANGSLLISQISEYSAIYLAHRFRRFDLDVLVGLSDEIHPSQSYDSDARGLVSKQNIRQNIHERIDLERAPVKIQNIMLTTTPTLEGYSIREYLGVISHHSVLSAQEIEEFSNSNPLTGDEIVDAIQRDLTEVLEKHGTHESEKLMPFGQGLETLYKEMADVLRTKALKIGANAIVGINYQLTPVIKNQSGMTDVQYKVTCLGSAVWAIGI